MSTGTELIKEALQQLNAHSIASPAAPESIENALKKLNSMVELWLSRNIRLGVVPLKVVGDDLQEPIDARNAIVSNLALLLAPDFDAGKIVVSKDLKASAARDFGQIQVIYQRHFIPNKTISSTTPLGQGNFRTFAG